MPEHHYEVLCTPRDKRKLYRDEHGSQNPVVHYGWICPVTSERIVSQDEEEARQLMLAHDCGGAGWCPVPQGRKADPEPVKDAQLKLL